MNNATLTGVRGIYRGWWVAIAGTAILFLLIGSQTGGTMGLFFVALESEFGWSRTLISGAFSVVRVEGSFLGPIEGFLTDRLGSHRMVLAGCVIAAGGFVILSFVSHPVHFYAALLFITGGVGIGGFIPVVTAVNWWFSKRRNRATGLAMAGVAMGALWSPLIAWGITGYGWRQAARVIAFVLLAAGIPLSGMLRRPVGDQASLESQPAVSTTTGEPDAESADGPEFTVRQALRTRAFWIIPLAHATNGFTTSAVYVHGIPHMTDVGLSLQTASYVMATYGALEVTMRAFGSFIGDHVDKRWAIAVYCAIQALGAVVLAMARSLPAFFLFTVLFAIGHGGRGPLIVAIRGEYFGRRQFGTIMGIGSLITSTSGIITPILLGVLYDAQQSYMVGFVSMAVLTFLGGFLVLLAKRPTLPGMDVPQPTRA